MKFEMTPGLKHAFEIVSGMYFQALEQSRFEQSDMELDENSFRFSGDVTPRGSVYLQTGRIAYYADIKKSIARF